MYKINISVKNLYSNEDSPKIWAYFRNESGSLVDPTTHTIDLFDPDGTKKVDDAAMTKSAVGKYYYQYHLATATAAMAKGQWRGRVMSVEGTGATAIVSTAAFSFKVK